MCKIRGTLVISDLQYVCPHGEINIFISIFTYSFGVCEGKFLRWNGDFAAMSWIKGKGNRNVELGVEYGWFASVQKFT